MAAEKAHQTNLKEIMKKCSIFTNNVHFFLLVKSLVLNPKVLVLPPYFNHTLLSFNSSPPIMIEINSGMSLSVP